MDSRLRRWLTEDASFATITGLSDAGDPTWSTLTPFKCRSEFEVQLHGPMFLPRAGEEQESFTRLFSEVDVPVDALVWLPGADTSDTTAAFRAKRRQVIRDDRGAVSHYEIYL